MEAYRRKIAALENRIRLMNPALFIVFMTVMPHLIPPVGFHPTIPAPEMVPTTTFRAMVEISAWFLWPLNDLGLAAMIALVLGTPIRRQEERVSAVFLKAAFISTFLAAVCTVLAHF